MTILNDIYKEVQKDIAERKGTEDEATLKEFHRLFVYYVKEVGGDEEEIYQ